MKPLLGRFLLNRWAILVFNVIIAFPLTLALIDLAAVLSHHPTHEMLHEAAETIEGMGVILIGWGVALEERHSLRSMFALIHHGDQDLPSETALDDLCHHYGLGLLLLGLFAEIVMECVKVPDRVINTQGIEVFVLSVSTVLLAIGWVFLVLHSVRIITAGR